MHKSCVVLLSGGLDSLLVTKLMAVQGLDVIAVHTLNCFHSSEKAAARMERIRAAASGLGAREVVFPDITEEVIETVRHPRFGYGKNLNPCIDCRLKTVAAGFRVMREKNAAFVATGEVVGQRPMSQRRDAIGIADREIASWGYPGLLVRPLSAKLLPKTVPETEGWVDPEYLFAFSGRGRGGQMDLAAELGIGDYPSPAGGCLLTDQGFSGRLGDLMRCRPAWNAADVELLKVGRHFLPFVGVRIVASRREEENRRLEELAGVDDLLFLNDEQNGAVVLLRGNASPDSKEAAAGLAVYFSKRREAGEARVVSWRAGGTAETGETFAAKSVDPDALRRAEAELKKAR